MKGKKLSHTLLIALYFISSMNFFIPVVGYYIFYDYIVKELCVQRTAEENLCMGKCHLKKQIKKSSQTDKETNQQNIQISSDAYSPHLLIDKSLNPQILGLHKSFLELSFSTINNYTEPLTPPPRSII